MTEQTDRETTRGSRRAVDAVTAPLACERPGDEAFALPAAEEEAAAEGRIGAVRRTRTGPHEAVGPLMETVQVPPSTGAPPLASTVRSAAAPTAHP
ncbi:hypothetical protein ACFU7Z_19895 [Kitasatospora sp. NPDC057518]|uniref:hypothetical protein n=1 Tax=Kitasatospora sp. NPDC057518 TaxID=3346155 RepID=UPI00367ED2A7